MELSTTEMLNILVFEDDPETVTTLSLIFKMFKKKYNWKFTISVDDSILNRFKTEKFHLLIVDIMIHSENTRDKKKNISYEGITWKKTGTEFIRRFRNGEYTNNTKESTLDSIPIIILSSIIDSATYELRGIDNIYFQGKPFTVEELETTIFTALERQGAV